MGIQGTRIIIVSALAILDTLTGISGGISSDESGLQ